MFVFEDIARFSDKDIQTVLKNVETSQWAMALKGASDALKEKILKNMSERAAETLREEMEYLGPAKRSRRRSQAAGNRRRHPLARRPRRDRPQRHQRGRRVGAMKVKSLRVKSRERRRHGSGFFLALDSRLLTLASASMDRDHSGAAPLMSVTPMMQQYHEAKRAAGDALLLFRMGDFYELFFEDAKTAARVLGLALTSRDKGDEPGADGRVSAPSARLLPGEDHRRRPPRGHLRAGRRSQAGQGTREARGDADRHARHADR